MPFLFKGENMKKLVFLSLFSILLLNYSIGHATNYHPFIYKTLKLANINFDDHVKALDYFIGKWKLLENPILTKDLIGRDEILYYDTPAGIDGGGGRDIVYENSKYISQLINAANAPLVAIHGESILDKIDKEKIEEASGLFSEAGDLIHAYAIRIYNIQQSYQDLSDLT